MSLILALALAQAPAFTGTVPQPNAALDAAHACLRAGVTQRLAANAPAPNAQERWDWALAIADACDAEINAAADSPEAMRLFAEIAHSTITKRHALRSEALYFADGLIRAHYEAKA